MGAITFVALHLAIWNSATAVTSSTIAEGFGTLCNIPLSILKISSGHLGNAWFLETVAAAFRLTPKTTPGRELWTHHAITSTTTILELWGH